MELKKRTMKICSGPRRYFLMSALHTQVQYMHGAATPIPTGSGCMALLHSSAKGLLTRLFNTPLEFMHRLWILSSL